MVYFIFPRINTWYVNETDQHDAYPNLEHYTDPANAGSPAGDSSTLIKMTLGNLPHPNWVLA